MRIRTKREILTSVFVAGMIFSTGIDMAIQDWYGLERYIAVVNAHWVYAPWWVGALIAIAGLLLLLKEV